MVKPCFVYCSLVKQYTEQGFITADLPGYLHSRISFQYLFKKQMPALRSSFADAKRKVKSRRLRTMVLIHSLHSGKFAGQTWTNIRIDYIYPYSICHYTCF